MRGQPVIGVVCYHTGSVEDGEEAFRPLRELPYVGVDPLGPMPYVAVQQLLDPASPKGMQNSWSGDFLAELPDEAVDVLVDRATTPVSPLSQVVLIPGGGAVAGVDEDAMAFGQRTAPWNLHYLSMWEDAAATEGAGRVEAAFGPAKYARLAELKRLWDPTNLFRHNQNISPAPQPVA